MNPGGIQLQARTRKVDGPSEAKFINVVDFAVMGMDVVMDVGLVQPETVAQAVAQKESQPNAMPVVDVFVSGRYGMSIQTLLGMQEKIALVLRGVPRVPQEKREAN